MLLLRLRDRGNSCISFRYRRGRDRFVLLWGRLLPVRGVAAEHWAVRRCVVAGLLFALSGYDTGCNPVVFRVQLLLLAAGRASVSVHA